MSMDSRLLALFTVSILVFACDDSPTAPGDVPIAFETVVRSSNSGFSTPQREVIRNAGDWADAWNLLYGRHGSAPPLPGIDFGREMVVLAAMGTSNNGCFQVEIISIRLRRAALDIEVTEFEPAPGCACTEAITQPVHVVRLERLALAENFIVQRRPLDC